MNPSGRTPSKLASTARAILLTLPALLAASLSQAGEPADANSMFVVSYDPASLYSEAGRQTLKLRIVHAARIVCERSRMEGEYNSCVDNTTRHALAAVEAQVTALRQAQAPAAVRAHTN
jgi:UrcA family protein